MKACRTAQLVAVGLAAAALALFASSAFADGTGAPKKKPDATADKAAPSFTDTVTDGATKYAARDFPGAIAAFQKAIEQDPKNPMGHYLLGEAQLAANNMTEAEAAWNRASLEANEKDPPLRAKILFVIADLKQRQKKWDEAKAAWQVYADWVNKYANAGFPGSSTACQHAIDIMQGQDKQYVVVRQRIADSKAGGVFSDVSKPSPAPASGAPPAAPAAPAPAH
jgi:tetratricopeptide (TPR) repeat protein